MRYVSYIKDGLESWGVVEAGGNHIYEARQLLGNQAPATLVEFIKKGETRALEDAMKSPSGAAISLDQVKLLSPIPRPVRNIFCVGKNYIDHILEFDKTKSVSNAALSHPAFFTKATHAMTGPFDEIDCHSGVTAQLDYEVELAVVIGKRGVNIKPEEVYDHIFGYTILNDITARDLQRDHLQWFKGKSLDGSCPMGPWIVSREEIPYPVELEISSAINGEVRQKSNTRYMIFDIPALVSILSQGLTLEPGDIIATGTPSGVGMGFDPPKVLKPGDVMRLEIEKIGFIENKVK